MTSHLIGCTFNEAEAMVAAAKAACLASALRDGSVGRLVPAFRYGPEQVAQLANITLSDPVLQRLKGGNPEAFHYWAMAERT